MPVEKKAKKPGATARAIPLPADEGVRQAFVDAIQLGLSKADVLARLDISQSTYYKWKSRWKELGDCWLNGELVTKAKHLPGLSVEKTHDELVELSLLHPTFGVKKLVEYLAKERGFHCAPTTVHAILKANNVNTRRQRASTLHQRFLTKVELTPEQIRLVRTIDPFAGSPHGQEKQPGRVLIQDAIQTHYTAPLNRCTLHIVVDASDQRAFAMFPEKWGKSSAADCLELALAKTRALGYKVEEVHTDNGYRFDKSPSGILYNALLSREGIYHRWRVSTNNRRNSLIADVWKSLKKYLFQDLRSECLENRDRPFVLNKKIQDFLDRKFGDG